MAAKKAINHGTIKCPVGQVNVRVENIIAARKTVVIDELVKISRAIDPERRIGMARAPKRGRGRKIGNREPFIINLPRQLWTVTLHDRPIIVGSIVGVAGKVKSCKTPRISQLSLIESDTQIVARSAEKVKIAVADRTFIHCAQRACRHVAADRTDRIAVADNALFEPAYAADKVVAGY